MNGTSRWTASVLLIPTLLIQRLPLTLLPLLSLFFAAYLHRARGRVSPNGYRPDREIRYVRQTLEEPKR